MTVIVLAPTTLPAVVVRRLRTVPEQPAPVEHVEPAEVRTAVAVPVLQPPASLSALSRTRRQPRG